MEIILLILGVVVTGGAALLFADYRRKKREYIQVTGRIVSSIGVIPLQQRIVHRVNGGYTGTEYVYSGSIDTVVEFRQVDGSLTKAVKSQPVMHSTTSKKEQPSVIDVSRLKPGQEKTIMYKRTNPADLELTSYGMSC